MMRNSKFKISGRLHQKTKSLADRQNSKIKNGITLILTLMILSGLLALSLGIATLLAREIKLSREIANSIIAYGAADTAIERFMYGVNNQGLDPATCLCPTNCYSGTLPNNTTYTVCTSQATAPVKIKSTGTYRGTNRSIQVTY